MLGSVSKKDTFALLDYFYEHGGNLIDVSLLKRMMVHNMDQVTDLLRHNQTANNYQSEESETWIGEWMASKPHLRDEMVVATKYTTCFTAYQGYENRIHSNSAGNGTKSLHVSVHASLRKLQTNYIDILYVHWWDFGTSIEELMQSLNILVQQGKVLYLGISDTPAWIVSKANQYARDHGLKQFVVYQGKWSAADRDFERDIMQMCAAEGMGIAPWNALGGGNFKTKAQRDAMGDEGRKVYLPEEKHIKVTEALEAVAKRHNTAVTSIALAYVQQKAPYVFPIVGGRKVEHLKGNIEALSLKLEKEDYEEIEKAWPFDVGFPNSFYTRDNTKRPEGPGDVWLMDLAGRFDYVAGQQPIRPGGPEKEVKGL